MRGYKTSYDNTKNDTKQLKSKWLSISSLDAIYLKSLFSRSASFVREQSIPPNPVLQAHIAVHRTSARVHDVSTLPDGSEYTQTPFPEHTEP